MSKPLRGRRPERQLDRKLWSPLTVPYFMRQRMEGGTSVECGVNNLYGLVLLARDVLTPDSTVIEIGSFKGVSTSLWAKLCKKVYVVDMQCRPKLRKRCQQWDNVEVLKGNSHVLHEQFEDGSVDGVYIDANHHYEHVYPDIMDYWPKATRFVAGHDLLTGDIGWLTKHYDPKGWECCEGVARAVDDLIGLENVRCYPDSSWATLKVTE